MLGFRCPFVNQKESERSGNKGHRHDDEDGNDHVGPLKNELRGQHVVRLVHRMIDRGDPVG